jgi:hypothetical protein
LILLRRASDLLFSLGSQVPGSSADLFPGAYDVKRVVCGPPSLAGVGVLADALEETLDEEDRRALAHALDLIERISGSIRGGRSFADGREFNTGSW